MKVSSLRLSPLSPGLTRIKILTMPKKNATASRKKEFSLSLSLLLDEDSQAKYLVNLLQAAGHNVLTVNQVGIVDFPDHKVLDYCRQSLSG
jgi:Domain of unknown function (DUF5615)